MKYTEYEFIEAVKNNINITNVLRELNLGTNSRNFFTCCKKIKELNLSTEHFQMKQKHNFHSKNLNLILTENSFTNTTHLKKKLIKSKLLENKCQICHIENWLDNPLTLQLDHINGIHKDNRLENLRLLCPNCHSQTPTHSGKNIRGKYLTNKCKFCKKLISSRKDFCNRNCYGSFRKENKIIYLQPTKIEWPTKEELEKLVWEMPTLQLSKKLGVSDKAIEKRCKKFGIIKPSRGYWK